MDYARNAAVNFINTFFQAANNPTGQNRIGIVTYSTTATIRANLTGSSGQAGLITIINGLNGSGTTNIQDGIVKGDQVMSAGTFNCLTARSMIVLSDGVANRTGTSGSTTCTDNTGSTTTTCITSAILLPIMPEQMWLVQLHTPIRFLRLDCSEVFLECNKLQLNLP